LLPPSPVVPQFSYRLRQSYRRCAPIERLLWVSSCRIRRYS
jgi:hypothetical protein